MTIEEGNLFAIYNLGHYYHFIEKDYDLMKKYYLMAIEGGDFDAMNNLGNYYQIVERNYDLMKKYYLMAIEREYSTSMNNLGHYYQNVEQNYDLAKKYYLMAIKNGNLNEIYHFTKLELYVNDVEVEEDEKIIKYKNKLRDSYKAECQICLKEYEIFKLDCNHEICKNCYIKIQSCPYCRKEV